MAYINVISASSFCSLFETGVANSEEEGGSLFLIFVQDGPSVFVEVLRSRVASSFHLTFFFFKLVLPLLHDHVLMAEGGLGIRSTTFSVFQLVATSSSVLLSRCSTR